MKSKSRMIDDPFKKLLIPKEKQGIISKPVISQKSKNVKEHKEDKPQRENFTIYPSQKLKLKYLSIETGRDLSELVRESLDLLFKKYKQK